MKHRLSCVCLLVAALLPIASCDVPPVMGPGSVTVAIDYLAPNRFNKQVDIVWTGTVSPTPPASDPRSLGLASVNTTITNFSQGGVLEPKTTTDTVTDNDIHAGTWTFTVTVKGTNTTGAPITILPATICTQHVAMVRATTIRFTEGMTGCTCTSGCS